MKRREVILGLVLGIGPACGLLLGLVNCALIQDISQTQGPTTINAPPSPSASASPVPSAPPAGQVARVEVHFFGVQQCPSGVSPATGAREVRVSCSQAITASPFDVNGVDVGHEGDAVSWSCSGPVAFVQQTNGYNGDVRGTAAGAFACTATVRGVAGAFAGTVIQ